MADSTAVARQQPADPPAIVLTPQKIELLKRTICAGVSDDELERFVHVARRLGLDPFARQIHAVKRRQRGDDGQYHDAMTIQVGIDGYRAIADRTGRYAPGQASTYEHDGERLVSATAYVRKQTADGQWHTVSETAHWDEYVQTYQRNGENCTSSMWRRMPHVMLAKCAEALALRRAFPAELAGTYTSEEMGQADTDERPPAKRQAPSGRGAPEPLLDGIRAVSALYRQTYEADLSGHEAEDRKAFVAWARSIADTDADLAKPSAWTTEIVDRCMIALQDERDSRSAQAYDPWGTIADAEKTAQEKLG